ncbi:MAG: hypothetical protein U0235_13355 [Polyangiaceae bacterium]
MQERDRKGQDHRRRLLGAITHLMQELRAGLGRSNAILVYAWWAPRKQHIQAMLERIRRACGPKVALHWRGSSSNDAEAVRAGTHADRAPSAGALGLDAAFSRVEEPIGADCRYRQRDGADRDAGPVRGGAVKIVSLAFASTWLPDLGS